jgi:quinol monooxygenase YgiN
MRSSYRLVAVLLVMIGAGCSSSDAEEAPGAEATEGSEMTQPELPAPPPEPTADPAMPPAPEETTPAAAVAEPPAPQMPPYAAIVMHEVKDFDAWKPVFDGDVEARKQAGIVGEGILRGVDNDKLVAVYMPATDPQQVKAMTESKELKDKMKEGGVKGKPTILVFKDAGGKMAPPGKTGLYGAVVQYNVKDFEAFKTGLEGQEEARSAAGIIGYGLGQSVDKETQAFVYMQSDDAAKLKTYLDAKETKQAMKDAGVKGQPKVTIVQEGPMAMYQ